MNGSSDPRMQYVVASMACLRDTVELVFSLQLLLHIDGCA